MPDANIEAYIRKIVTARPRTKRKIIDMLMEHYGWNEEQARLELGYLEGRKMVWTNFENHLVWGR